MTRHPSPSLDQQDLQTLGSLTARAAHELANQLTPLVGFAEMALRTLAASDPLREDLEQILHSARRAAELVNRLLLISSRRRMPPGLIDLNVAVQGMVPMLQKLLPSSIRFATSLERELPRVPIDAFHVEQILLNLVVNARDAMPLGGSLIIATESEDRPVVNGHPGRQWVRLIVRDNGVGMNAETRERVFEPFFSTKKTGQGSGLGLTIVGELVRQQGGDVDIESAPGRGTSVIISLPCDLNPDADLEASPDA